jgi:nucleoside-diphosphate-sugar epimerase
MTKRTSQKVLVTGGGGFLGKAIVKLLLEKKCRVRSFSRSYYPELASMGVEQFQGDIADKTSVEKACKEIDLVFHVAAKAGVWGKYFDYYRTNVTGTQNIIEACKKNNVSKLIYTSSPSVIFNGTDMEGVNESCPYPSKYNAYYPKTKALAEQAVIAASNNLLTVILRPHLIWGPEDSHIVPRIISRANQLVIVGNGKNVVDTIYIDNAAYAHILAAEKLDENPGISGNIYFISQGKPVLLWEMINNILKAGGLPPIKRSISHKAAWVIGAIFELVYNTINIKNEPVMTRFVANELAKSHWFDISAAQNDLGYIPMVSTEEGLKRLKAWLS